MSALVEHVTRTALLGVRFWDRVTGRPVADGLQVPPFYDSLLAKLIVWDADRDAAVSRALRALGELEVEGVPTTRDIAAHVIRSREFRSGDYSTGTLAGLVELVA